MSRLRPLPNLGRFTVYKKLFYMRLFRFSPDSGDTGRHGAGWCSAGGGGSRGGGDGVGGGPGVGVGGAHQAPLRLSAQHAATPGSRDTQVGSPRWNRECYFLTVVRVIAGYALSLVGYAYHPIRNLFGNSDCYTGIWNV